MNPLSSSSLLAGSWGRALGVADALAAGMLGASAAAAAPGRIASLSSSPAGAAQVGEAVTLVVGHTGDKCGFVLRTGEGPAEPARTLSGASYQHSKTYQQLGPKTVEVVGKKKGNKPACKGGPRTLVLQVGPAGEPGGSAPTIQRSRAKGQGLTRVPPKIQKATPDKPLGPVTPPLREAGGERAIQGKPRIKNVLPIVPDGDAITDVGVIAPGTKLYLSGDFFGAERGKLLIKAPTVVGFGSAHKYGEVVLEDVVWESPTKVHGTVPTVIAEPLERISIKLFLERADGAVSAPYPLQFQVPSETRWLTMNDVALRHCGPDSNTEVCNGSVVEGLCGAPFMFRVEPDYTPKSGAAIEGYHLNCTAAVGDDSGHDEYAISLGDGWVFDRIETGGITSTRPFPKGADFWAPRYQWTVSPGDDLHYWAKIRVRRKAQ